MNTHSNFAVFQSLVLLIGCTPESIHSPVPVEYEEMSHASEIGALAESQLAKIENDSEWISAAVEVAIARHASGNSTRVSALLQEASSKAHVIEEPEQRAIAFLAIATVMVDLGLGDEVDDALNQAQDAAEAIVDENKRWDVIGKLASARASSGQSEVAANAARRMPASNDVLASYKARTLQEIAPIQAKNDDLDVALDTISAITMGLAYYRATSRSDVAVIANERGRSDLAADLLQTADAISRAQTDGYFVAGALRHIAAAHAEIGNEAEAARYFSDALEGAHKGESPQHQARAISRVATALADLGFFQQAAKALPEAIEIAESEPREAFRLWALYEIAGAAAFSGDFSTAGRLLDLIPRAFQFGNSTLKAAAQRDVAWGFARHNRPMDAVELAMGIESPRERVQALSRIVRVLTDTKMKALPRYL